MVYRRGSSRGVTILLSSGAERDASFGVVSGCVGRGGGGSGVAGAGEVED